MVKIVFQGEVLFFENAVTFDPIDRICIPGGFSLLSNPRRLHLPYSIYGFGT